MLQALLTSLSEPQPNRGLQGGSHGAGPREDPIETHLIEALISLQARPKFHEIVSTPNDYHQTLAHLSILYDYPSLLGRLVEWHIDLTIADVNGLTALHCAYMKGDLDSVHILRRGGASEIVTDRLGRTPSELQREGLEGFDSDIDPEARLAGLDAGVYPEAGDIDEQWSVQESYYLSPHDDDADSPSHSLASSSLPEALDGHSFGTSFFSPTYSSPYSQPTLTLPGAGDINEQWSDQESYYLSPHDDDADSLSHSLASSSLSESMDALDGLSFGTSFSTYSHLTSSHLS